MIFRTEKHSLFILKSNMKEQLTESKNYRSKHSIWYPLYLLSFYRLLQAILLIVLAPTEFTFAVLGKYNPVIYNLSASLYLIVSILIFILIRSIQQSFLLQLYLQFFADLLLIGIMLFASGGISSGISLLLLFILIIYCFMVRGITPYFLAAIFTLTILTHEVYTSLTVDISDQHLLMGGLHGIVFFGIAALTQLLSKQFDENEILANQRFVALSNLEQLNAHIVNKVQNGMMVISNNRKILLSNQKMFEIFQKQPTPKSLLYNFSQELNDCLDFWLLDKNNPNININQPGNPYGLKPEFTRLHLAEPLILITLQDTASTSKQIQSQKLTSLGRLTASIAHEIRNPLSAISHAAQLLEESPDLDQADKRLADIIQQQTVRMNSIVENILQLSKKTKSSPEFIDFHTWIEQFKSQFCADTRLAPDRFKLNLEPNLTGAFDKTQLHQILWNLCFNSTKYGKDDDGEVTLHIQGQADETYVHLKIFDEGYGIPRDISDHIFEPFYTGNHNKKDSTGLGLFIAHELCLINHGHLEYVCSTPDQHWHFKISIPLSTPTNSVSIKNDDTI